MLPVCAYIRDMQLLWWTPDRSVTELSAKTLPTLVVLSLRLLGRNAVGLAAF